MDTKTQNNTDTKTLKDMEEVFISGENPKDKTPIPVIVNGYRYLVPVNQRVKVPRSVAEVLEHRQKIMEQAAAFEAENTN